MSMTTNTNDIPYHWHQAETALLRKDWKTAEKHYRAVLALDAGHVQSLARLVSVRLQLDDFGQAREFCLAAAALPCTDGKTLLMVARQLAIFCEKQRLRDYINGSRSERFADSQTLAELSTLLNSASGIDDALRLVDAAIAKDARSAPAHYFRGNLHMFLGDTDSARRDIERCLALNPGFAQAYWVQSGFGDPENSGARIARIRERLALAKPGLKDEIYLSIALHNELHRTKDHEAAWKALAYGNAAKRKQVPYRPEDTQRLFQALKSVDWSGVSDHSRASTGESAPIFIVGMHRSGTTLLEQMLAGHADIRDGGESASFGTQLKRVTGCNRPLDAEQVARLAQADLGRVGPWYAENNAWRPEGRRYFTEKLPSNFVNIGFILKTVPGARLINLVRDPMGTCFSNLRNLFNFECGYSYDQTELADYFAWYRDLMAFWHQTFPGAILDVHYDRLVAEPEAAMKEVCGHLGLDYHPNMVALQTQGRRVATASTVTVREGLQTGRNAQWHPYREHLRPLQERLASHGLI